MSYGSPYPPKEGAPGPMPGPSIATTDEERMWAMLAHMAGFIFAIFGPLIIWMVKKDTSPFVVDQAKEALNFQLTVTIVNLILSATVVGICVVPFVFIGAVVYSILGGLEANKGLYYRYPYTFRMIS